MLGLGPEPDLLQIRFLMFLKQNFLETVILGLKTMEHCVCNSFERFGSALRQKSGSGAVVDDT
jgi:hypothetical protein